jgi:hypothetical protein
MRGSDERTDVDVPGRMRSEARAGLLLLAVKVEEG